MYSGSVQSISRRQDDRMDMISLIIGHDFRIGMEDMKILIQNVKDKLILKSLWI